MKLHINRRSAVLFLLLLCALGVGLFPMYSKKDGENSQVSESEITASTQPSSALLSKVPEEIVNKGKLLAPVALTEKVTRREVWGYINSKGEVVIDFQFQDAYPFSEGLAAVKIGGKYGFINDSGEIVIEPQFEAVKPVPHIREFRGFSRGFAVVRTGEKWCYINKMGENSFKLEFEYACPFIDEFATVRCIDSINGFINLAGEVYLRLDSSLERLYSLSYGLAGYRDSENGLRGFMDKDGNTIIEPQFESTTCFIEGRCDAIIDDSGVIYCIDKTGEKVFFMHHLYDGHFHDGRRIIADPTNAEEAIYIMVDLDGRRIGKAVFTTTSNFYNGLKVEQEVSPLRYGYIDFDMNWVIEPQFYSARPFTYTNLRNVH